MADTTPYNSAMEKSLFGRGAASRDTSHPRRRRAAWAGLPLLCLAAMLSACLDFRSKEVAGGTSETSNGDLQARVTYADGRPAAQVQVLVVDDAGWMAKISEGKSVVLDSQRTDDKGRLRLKLPQCERCNLQVDAEAEGLFLEDVVGLIKRERAAGHDVDELELAPFGSVSGHVMSDSITFLRLAGSTYATPADDGGYFFRDVSEGEYELVPIEDTRVLPSDSTEYRVAAVKADSALAGPDARIAPPYGHGVFATWPRFRKIPITVPGGTEDSVLQFPFLVRLDSSNFDFSQSDGEDIRFSDWRGFEVPHAVVSYDPLERRAEIWVKALYTKGRSDSLVLLWGKAGAHGTSNSHGVFPDYAAVLHPQATALAGGGYKYNDASPGRNVPKGTAAPIKAGKIGDGLAFTPAASAYMPPDSALRPARDLTLSAWVRAAGKASSDMEILSMAGHYGLRIRADGLPVFYLRNDSTTSPSPSDTSHRWSECIAGVNLLDEQWHYLVAVYDGALMRLYVDGMEVATLSRLGSLVYPTTDGNFRIGEGSQECGCSGFNGSLDEIRLSPAAFSPGRIRTEFENQK